MFGHISTEVEVLKVLSKGEGRTHSKDVVVHSVPREETYLRKGRRYDVPSSVLLRVKC